MRKMMVVVILLGLVAVVAYFVFGYVVFTRLADLRGSCDQHLDNRPDRFTNITDWPVDDFSPFYMPATYETVRFPSRDANLQLSGWYVEADPAAPAIIVVDGLGGCKYAQATRPEGD